MMSNLGSILRSSLWTLGGLLFGTVVGVSIFYGPRFFTDAAKLEWVDDLQAFASRATEQKISDEHFFYKPIEKKVPTIPAVGKAVYADLNTMTLRLYENGTSTMEFSIVSKGRPGSYWETPTGEYRTLTKAKDHFSSIGSVWMPYSIGFFGNFFIHGWPYYPNGESVPRGFSGGCIRLETEDAKKVFEFVDSGTPIFVTEDRVPSANEPSYIPLRHANPPRISAKAFLVADIDNNYVFLEKNRSDQRSIASITKLMTAIISLEAINQERKVELTAKDIDIYGDTGSLQEGEEFTAKDLLTPLLLSSSNDASYALARLLGTDRFVKLMNEKAKAIGLEHTEFTDPSGLQLGNISSPEDLVRLIAYVRDVHEPLLTISRKRTARLTSNKATHEWFNFNWKSEDPEFIGGKIGFSDAAGKTMVSLFRVPMSEFATRDIGIVVLGSNDQAGDVKKLRDWVKDNFLYGHVPQDPKLVGVSPFPNTATQYGSDERFTMVFAGDVMMNRGIEKVIEEHGNGDFLFPFRNIMSVISDADLAFANLEGPIADKGEKRGSIYSFRMDPRTTKALYDAGFDVVSASNNHMGDYGREALEDTFRRLRRAGIVYAGAGWNKVEAESVRVIERAGQRIGFAAFSDVGPEWMRAGDTLSGIAIADVATVQKVIRQARDQVDIMIVSFHFGEEYETSSRKRQQDLARGAIDAGANIVIGHHPHVVQEIEQYKGGLIAYSLGNFIFDQAFSPETKEGLLVRLHMKGKQIEQVERIPVSFNTYFQPSPK